MRGQDLDNFGRSDSKSLDDAVAADSPPGGSPVRQRRRAPASQVCDQLPRCRVANLRASVLQVSRPSSDSAMSHLASSSA